MHKLSRFILVSMFFLAVVLGSCVNTDNGLDDKNPDIGNPLEDFYFGVDLSYVNQIQDFNGEFRDEGEMKDPYQIFSEHGADLVRFRLWHNPRWTKDVYEADGKQLYNDLLDIEKSISASKAQGMKVLLDFHYSDVWADPGRQEIPQVWQDITSIDVLKDSVYNYTHQTLVYLAEKGLMPEFVQVGNETNCGMMFTEAQTGFPKLNVCEENWSNIGEVFNSAIDAIRDVADQAGVETKVILHVADPVNIQWWFDNIIEQAKVTDFEIIGFSYYPIWHDSIKINTLGSVVSGFKKRYNKDIVMLEVAYPWTSASNDNYNNIFGAEHEIAGYPLTKAGQKALLHDITQQVIDGGGIGVIYWEPAWITSEMKDLWGTGSSWENCTFFDFDGNVHEGICYMKDEYK